MFVVRCASSVVCYVFVGVVCCLWVFFLIVVGCVWCVGCVCRVLCVVCCVLLFVVCCRLFVVSCVVFLMDVVAGCR